MSLAATWKAIIDPPVEGFPRLIPDAHPIAAFFILRRLKHLGFSNCRVTSTGTGLLVHAER